MAKKPKVTFVITEELQYDDNVPVTDAIASLRDSLPKLATKAEQKGKIKDAITELIKGSIFSTNPPPHYGVDQEIDPQE